MTEIERVDTASDALDWFKVELSYGKCSDTCPQCNAYEMAIAALTEQAARSKGCEVCNGSLPCDNGCDGFCDICDVPEVWKTIHKTGQYNYCPMCGRKLREDNNEAD